MNRYPLWKYLVVLVTLVLGLLYTLPNFFGESPAIQITSTNVTRKVDENTLRQVESVFQREQIPYTGAYYSIKSQRRH